MLCCNVLSHKGWKDGVCNVTSVVGVLCCDDDTFPLDCAALTPEHLSPLKADQLEAGKPPVKGVFELMVFFFLTRLGLD